MNDINENGYLNGRAVNNKDGGIMHKRMLGFLVLICAAMMLFGCGMNVGRISVGTGAIYTDVKAPHPDSVTSSSVGTKSGTATAVSILGLVCTGDASIQTAASNGGIKTINHVDYHDKIILWVYREYTTIVWGN